MLPGKAVAEMSNLLDFDGDELDDMLFCDDSSPSKATVLHRISATGGSHAPVLLPVIADCASVLQVADIDADGIDEILFADTSAGVLRYLEYARHGSSYR